MSQNNQDPKDKFPQPPMQEHPQSYPGLEADMNIKPDYGQDSYKGCGKLTGKTALITGGDSGIGRAVAVAFAKEGADVMIGYLPEEQEDANQTISAIQAAGRKGVGFAGDIKDKNYCKELINQALKEFGKLDILVNNAAFQKYFTDINEITWEDFETIFQTNVFATFYLAQQAAQHMQKGSAIINTASIEAFEPKPLLLPYSASKGAIVTMTKALSEALIEKGIRVNAVAPGPIWTPLNTHASPPDKLSSFGESTPIKRAGQPIELAPVYVLLASDQGSYITGEVYGVTGGKGVV
ncbi:MAG: hypothetical protein JWO40_867 [Candidatus Doudnabacteria bacterium]|nr:hypothetical protein [Candidatus Doudnabacteria bacterium]